MTETTAAEAMLIDDVPSLRQKWYLSRAEQETIAQCMHSLGFSYFVPSPGPEPSAQTTTEDAIGSRVPATYGVVPQETGAPSHSSRNSGGSSQAAVTAEDQYVDGLPKPLRARYESALGGSAHQIAETALPSGIVATYGTGGCIGSARRQIFGSVLAFVRDFYVPQDVGQQLGAYLSTYRPYMAALRDWRGCMASAELRFDSPESAIASIENLASEDGTSSQGLEARQAAVAGADVTCDGRSHLRLRTHEGLTAYIHTLPGRTLADLSNVYATQQKAVQQALRELSS